MYQFNDTLFYMKTITNLPMVLETYHTVYLTLNTINGKIYVGVHSTTYPLDNYLGSGWQIRAAVEKYGYDKFIKIILSVFNDKQSAYDLESDIVTEEFSNSPLTYNMAVGGCGGDNSAFFTEEIIEKMREGGRKSRGKKYGHYSEERRKAISDGLKRSPNIKRKPKQLFFKIPTAVRNAFMNKGRVWIKNDATKETKFIHPNTNEYKSLLAQGWSRGRFRSIKKGFVLLKNEKLQEQKFVESGSIEFNELLDNGWEKGTLNKIKEEQSKRKTGVSRTDPVFREKMRQIGLNRVKSAEEKEKLSKARRGLVALKNEQLGIFVYKRPNTPEYEALINSGWACGMIKRKKK